MTSSRFRSMNIFTGSREGEGSPPGESGDFYLIPIPPEWDSGRVNWLDESGNEGSRGIDLMPAG